MAEAELKQRVSSQSNIPLDQIIFDGTTKTIELPKAHGKGITIMMSGSFKLAYTGAPTVKTGGIMANLIENIEVKDARGLLKDIKVVDLHDHAERLTGDRSPLVYVKGPAVTKLDSTSTMNAYDLPLPANNDIVFFAESIHLPFECDIALANFLDTLLQYNGRDINTMRLIMNKIESLFVGGTGVVVSNVDIKIDLNYLTMANSGLGRRWRQWQAERAFTASATKAKMELNSVDSLAGLKIEITKGAARAKISPDEAMKIKFDLSVRKNGVETYLHSDESLLLLNMQDANKKSQYKINPSRGYMNMITGNLIESAEQNTYSEMNLLVTLPTGLPFDVNNAYNVRLLVDEIE